MALGLIQGSLFGERRGPLLLHILILDPGFLIPGFEHRGPSTEVSCTCQPLLCKGRHWQLCQAAWRGGPATSREYCGHVNFLRDGRSRASVSESVPWTCVAPFGGNCPAPPVDEPRASARNPKAPCSRQSPCTLRPGTSALATAARLGC